MLDTDSFDTDSFNLFETTNAIADDDPGPLTLERLRQAQRAMTGPPLLIQPQPLVEKGSVLLVGGRLVLVNPIDREELEKSLEEAGAGFREATKADHAAMLQEVTDPEGRGPFVWR